jgi:hypothetical protein
MALTETALTLKFSSPYGNLDTCPAKVDVQQNDQLAGITTLQTSKGPLLPSHAREPLDGT